jgi:hypothetical protein
MARQTDRENQDRIPLWVLALLAYGSAVVIYSDILPMLGWR